MADIDTQKLFRQAVASPSDYDGSKKDFANWWSNMQFYLLGYASILNKGKIIALLSRLTKGDATFWAQAKKEDIIKQNLRKFDEFRTQLEQQFADPICPQQALNEIHSFTQGKMSAQAFLNKFEILKGISRLKDIELLYLLRRGLTPCIMSLIYGSDVASPYNYNELCYQSPKDRTQLRYQLWLSACIRIVRNQQ